MKSLQIHQLRNIYIQELPVSPTQFQKYKAEVLVISFYRSKGYEVEKIMSSHNIFSKHEEVSKILRWYKSLIIRKELGENGIPDLIVYKNAKDWFFVEVKAYNDTVRPIQLIWYRKHQQYPIRICLVLPSKNSKNLYIAKKQDIRCNHPSLIEVYKRKDGTTFTFSNKELSNHKDIKGKRIGHTLLGSWIGDKCEKCGMFISRQDFSKSFT